MLVAGEAVRSFGELSASSAIVARGEQLAFVRVAGYQEPRCPNVCLVLKRIRMSSLRHKNQQHFSKALPALPRDVSSILRRVRVHLFLLGAQSASLGHQLPVEENTKARMFER